MHIYASILNWYDVWWLNYMFICNHFGWNETRVLGIKKNHGTICIYMLHYDWIDMICDDWIKCSYVTILVEMKLECQDWKKIKVPMYLYASIWLNWYDMWWLNYMFICHHFGWNEIRLLRIERKSRYHVYICIICFSMIELIWYVMTELYVHI